MYEKPKNREKTLKTQFLRDSLRDLETIHINEFLSFCVDSQKVINENREKIKRGNI